MDAINGPEIDLDRLAARSRTNLERRRLARPSPSDPQAARSPPEVAQQSEKPIWSSNAVPLVREALIPERIQLHLPEQTEIACELRFAPSPDGRYRLLDLLQYQDRDFIHAAYHAVVGRPSDAEGLANYLGHLRRGMSKIEILEALRDSSEGRSVDAPVVGLSLRCSILKISRWPLIGPLLRIAGALSGLPESERNQRAFQGAIIAKVEAGQLGAHNARAVQYRALRELQAGHHALLDYAAAKPGENMVRKIGAAVAQSTAGLAALHSSLEAKVNREDLRRATDELQGLLETLQNTKAERDDLNRTASDLGEVSAALRILGASKADLSALDDVHLQLTRATRDRHEHRELIDNLVRTIETAVMQSTAGLAALHRILETKVDREDLQHSSDELQSALQNLQRTKAEKDDLRHSARGLIEVSAALRVLGASKADRSAVDGIGEQLTRALGDRPERRELTDVIDQLRNSIQVDVGEISAALKKLSGSKADGSRLEETRRELIQALETRPERYELTALTNHLVSLVESRANKDDIAPLQRSHTALVRQATDDRAAFELARGETTIALRGIGGALEELRQTTAGALGSKADVSALHSLKGDLAALAEADRAGVDLALVKLASKIDSARAEATIGIQAASNGSAERMELLLQEKAAIDTLERLRLELKCALEKTLEAVTEKTAALSRSKVGVEQLDASVAEMKNSFETVRRHMQEELQHALVPIAAQSQDSKRTLLDQERRLGLLLEEARKRLPKPMSTKQVEAIASEDTHLLDAMYASFEDRFRGSRADIKERARIYLPYILAAKAGTADSAIVDLGCGRGEWLELLRDEQLVGLGIDTNRVFLDTCRDMNLDVIGSDALQYLRGRKPNSFGAITSFHLIEHLPMKLLIALIDESLRVLKPGGIIILETPNPENLQVGACNFYTDPTHHNPIPPILTEALLELRGFIKPLIVRRDQEKLRSAAPPRIATGQPLAANINPIIEVMLSNFFVSPDYAVIAAKA
jgi:SAM-dependent methyltransferase